MKRTKDRGAESEAMYDSDMALFAGRGNGDPEMARILSDNIALMKRWAAEGK